MTIIQSSESADGAVDNSVQWLDYGDTAVVEGLHGEVVVAEPLDADGNHIVSTGIATTLESFVEFNNRMRQLSAFEVREAMNARRAEIERSREVGSIPAVVGPLVVSAEGVHIVRADGSRVSIGFYEGDMERKTHLLRLTEIAIAPSPLFASRKRSSVQ